ncbi:hypothetical protein THIOKS12710017 [Thiocapsa sp. KS1]|nr:hypothetical protein THIOKS12710017 [Thiocapsa sp. KS1]
METPGLRQRRPEGAGLARQRRADPERCITPLAPGAVAAINGAALAFSGQGLILASGLPAFIPLAHPWHERGRAKG